MEWERILAMNENYICNYIMSSGEFSEVVKINSPFRLPDEFSNFQAEILAISALNTLIVYILEFCQYPNFYHVMETRSPTSWLESFS